MGADQTKLLEAGEILTNQLQVICQRMEEISEQNKNLLTEKNEEFRKLKLMVLKQAPPEVRIGHISEFDSKYEWSHWYERFELFCTINNIKQEKKVLLFLTMIGNEGYSLLKNLCASEDLKSKSCTELSKIMKDHLEPECNIVTERYNFKERRQFNQEKIKDYVANLKSLASKCNFENYDNCLRDQFVWGLKDEIIKKKLLDEVNLTFKRAVEIATSMNNEAKNISPMNDNKDTVSGDNTVKNSKAQTKYKITCYCCGKANHSRKKCQFRNDKCQQCGVIGHTQALCPEKKMLKDITTINKSTDKNTFVRNGNIQNTCMREQVHDYDYHLRNTKPLYDRDNVNHSFPGSPPHSQRSNISNDCCYCNNPILSVHVVSKLNCQHSAHQECFNSFKGIMQCQLCNVRKY